MVFDLIFLLRDSAHALLEITEETEQHEKIPVMSLSCRQRHKTTVAGNSSRVVPSVDYCRVQPCRKIRFFDTYTINVPTLGYDLRRRLFQLYLRPLLQTIARVTKTLLKQHNCANSLKFNIYLNT